MGLGKQDADVIIKIAMQLINSGKEVDKQLKDIGKKAGLGAGKAAKKALSKAFNQRMAFNQKSFELKKLLSPEQFKAVKKEMSALGRTVQGKLMTPLQRLNLASKITTNKMNKAFHTSKIKFQGWAMSIMFFGMAMKKIFDDIWKRSVKVFNDVKHSTEGTVTAFDILKGSLTYIGFLIGQALEPFMEYLIPIVEKVREWIEEHPKLAGWITIIGTLLGTLLLVFGALTLAIVNGFIPAIGLIGKGFEWAAASALTTFGVPLLAVIGAIVLAIISLVILWKSDFGSIKKFFIETFKTLWLTVKTVFQTIWDIIKYTLKAIVAIFKGDWELAGKYILVAIIKAVGGIVKILMGLQAVFFNIQIFVINLVKDLLFKIILGFILTFIEMVIKSFIDMIQGIVKLFKLDKLPWFNNFINNLDTIKDKMGGLSDVGKNMADKLTISYVTADSVKKGMGSVGRLEESLIAKVGLPKEEKKAPIHIGSVNIQTQPGEDGGSLWEKLLAKIEGRS